MEISRAAIIEHHEQRFFEARSLIDRTLKKFGMRNAPLAVHQQAVRYAERSWILAQRTRAKEQKIIALRTLAAVHCARAMKSKKDTKGIEVTRAFLGKAVELARRHEMYVELARSLALERDFACGYRSAPRQ